MYYNRDGTPVQGANNTEIALNWAKQYETDDRHVGDDTISGYRVSTVFLGLDHSFNGGPPLIFETMVFNLNNDGTSDTHDDVYCDRYSTEAEALEGHNTVVQKIVNGTFTDYLDEIVDTTYKIEEEPTLI